MALQRLRVRSHELPSPPPAGDRCGLSARCESRRPALGSSSIYMAEVCRWDCCKREWGVPQCMQTSKRLCSNILCRVRVPLMAPASRAAPQGILPAVVVDVTVVPWPAGMLSPTGVVPAAGTTPPGAVAVWVGWAAATVPACAGGGWEVNRPTDINAAARSEPALSRSRLTSFSCLCLRWWCIAAAPTAAPAASLQSGWKASGNLGRTRAVGPARQVSGTVGWLLLWTLAICHCWQASGSALGEAAAQAKCVRRDQPPPRLLPHLLRPGTHSAMFTECLQGQELQQDEIEKGRIGILAAAPPGAQHVPGASSTTGALVTVKVRRYVSCRSCRCTCNGRKGFSCVFGAEDAARRALLAALPPPPPPNCCGACHRRHW